MKRVVYIDREYKCNAKKAIHKFFKKYPEFSEEWKDIFEYMAENGVKHFSDYLMADGTENKNWSYSLWLENDCDCHTYIALIVRA